MVEDGIDGMRTKCNSSFDVIQRTKWKPSGHNKKIEKIEKKGEQKTTEENKKVGKAGDQKKSKMVKMVKDC